MRAAWARSPAHGPVPRPAALTARSRRRRASLVAAARRVPLACQHPDSHPHGRAQPHRHAHHRYCYRQSLFWWILWQLAGACTPAGACRPEYAAESRQTGRA